MTFVWKLSDGKSKTVVSDSKSVDNWAMVQEQPDFAYVILEYRNSQTSFPIILVGLQNDQSQSPVGELRFDGKWKRKVAPSDHEYIEAILADFTETTTVDPIDVIRRTEDVQIGVLRTLARGECDEAVFESLCNKIANGTYVPS